MVRVSIALVIDFLRPKLLITELITDFSICIVFTSLLVLLNRKASFKKVHPLFGILFIILMGVNFLQFGGINGTNCFNYYSSIYVIVMLYSNRTLYSMVIFQLVFLIGLIYLVFVNHPLYQAVLISTTQANTEFIFSLLAISVFTFYLKYITIYEIKKSEEKEQELNQKVETSEQLNRQLIQQSEQLKKAQNSLKHEVSLRVATLEKRKAVIEQYIHHNTTTLKDPLVLLSTAINQFKGDEQFRTLLKVSNAELTQVISKINQALRSEEDLNRSTLEKN